MQLANSLQGIVTQTLLPRADGSGRVCALEILFMDDAIRNLVRQGKIEQVYSYMQTGTRRGMQTMEQSLAELVRRCAAYKAAVDNKWITDALLVQVAKTFQGQHEEHADDQCRRPDAAAPRARTCEP